MRCRMLWIFVLLAAACKQGGSEPQASRPNADKAHADYAQQWANSCTQLRKQLPAGAARRFEPWPGAAQSNAKTWSLCVGELSVSIPAGSYEVRPVPSGEYGAAILVGSTLTISLIRNGSLAPMPDVFAKVGQPRKPDSAAMTRTLFGQPPTSHDLDLIAYQHGPDDLTCQAARWREEMPIAIALALKTEGPFDPATLHVYRDVFGVGDITRVARQGAAWFLEAEVAQPKETYAIVFRAADEATLRATVGSAQLGHCAARPTQGPAWIGKLAAALEHPDTPANWVEVADALAADGASPKSLEALRAAGTRASATMPARTP